MLCEENFVHLHLDTQHPLPSLSSPPQVDIRADSRAGGTPEILSWGEQSVLTSPISAWSWLGNGIRGWETEATQGREIQLNEKIMRGGWLSESSPRVSSCREPEEDQRVTEQTSCRIPCHKELWGVCRHRNWQKGDMADVYRFFSNKTPSLWLTVAASKQRLVV